MPIVTYAEALATAIDEAMRADDRVVLIGSRFAGLVGEQQPHFDAVEARYPDRVVHPPSSELAVTGMGIGAAANGLRPIVDVLTASFVFQAFGQVVNEAPNIAYSTNGRTRVPVLFYMIGGIRGSGASQHSHRPESMFWNTPGLQVALPATPGDAYGLMRHYLLESDQPTAFIVHHKLLATEQVIDDWEAERLGPGRGRIEREGGDVTIVATSIMVRRALDAARDLADRDGISCEVVNLRTLTPYDDAIVAQSVTKTGRVVVADETNRSAGVGAEIVARIAEAHHADLKCGPRRVSTPDTPIPFSSVLEDAVIPTADKIADAVIRMCETT